MRKMGITVFLVAAFGASVAMADLIDSATYTINFTGDIPLPTSGSFTFDPDTATFTAFSVTWYGVDFDLTAAANAPTTQTYPACLGGATLGDASFALMSGACNTYATGNHWFATYNLQFGAPFFGFQTGVDQLHPDQFLSINANASAYPIEPNLPRTISGDWTITPSVPEPSSFILMSTTLFAAAFLGRKRIALRLQQATRTNT